MRKKIETPRPKETHEKRDFVTRNKSFRDSEIGSRISEIHDFLGTIRHPLNCARRFDYLALGSSRKLGGAAEHLFDGSEKRICRLSFEF